MTPELATPPAEVVVRPCSYARLRYSNIHGMYISINCSIYCGCMGSSHREDAAPLAVASGCWGVYGYGVYYNAGCSETFFGGVIGAYCGYRPPLLAC